MNKMMITETEKKKRCDKCKSDKVIKMGKIQASGCLKQRYYCNKCFHFFYTKEG